ncbi:hypothetical protein BJ912DRAFT_1049650 [Pholiota molesta]|nr:hypothetical protein BJ912DRAFT_1049650 [Pholiota molesta]
MRDVLSDVLDDGETTGKCIAGRFKRSLKAKSTKSWLISLSTRFLCPSLHAAAAVTPQPPVPPADHHPHRIVAVRPPLKRGMGRLSDSTAPPASTPAPNQGRARELVLAASHLPSPHALTEGPRERYGEGKVRRVRGTASSQGYGERGVQRANERYGEHEVQREPADHSKAASAIDGDTKAGVHGRQQATMTPNPRRAASTTVGAHEDGAHEGRCAGRMAHTRHAKATASGRRPAGTGRRPVNTTDGQRAERKDDSQRTEQIAGQRGRATASEYDGRPASRRTARQRARRTASEHKRRPASRTDGRPPGTDNNQRGRRATTDGDPGGPDGEGDGRWGTDGEGGSHGRGAARTSICSSSLCPSLH